MRTDLVSIERDVVRLQLRLHRLAVASALTGADPRYEVALEDHELADLVTPRTIRRVVDAGIKNAWPTRIRRTAGHLVQEALRYRLAPINRRAAERRAAEIGPLLAHLAASSDPEQRRQRIEELCAASARLADLAQERIEEVHRFARDVGFATGLDLVAAVLPLLRFREEAAAVLASGEGGIRTSRPMDAPQWPSLARERILPALRTFARTHFPAHHTIKIRGGRVPMSGVWWRRGPESVTTVSVVPVHATAYRASMTWILAFHELGHAFHFSAPGAGVEARAAALLDEPLQELLPGLFETLFANDAARHGLAVEDEVAFQRQAAADIVNLRLFGGAVPFQLDDALLSGLGPDRIERRFASALDHAGMKIWSDVPERGCACWYRMSTIPVFEPARYLSCRAGEQLHQRLCGRFGRAWSTSCEAWNWLSHYAANLESLSQPT